MAAGDISTAGLSRSIKLLEGATAVNAVPSGAVGVEVNNLISGLRPEKMAVSIFSTAGTVTLTVTARLWVRHAASGTWAPLGTGTDAGKGVLNGGAAIGETDTDAIRHTEVVDCPPALFDRLYLQISAIGGTGTAIDAYAVIEGR